MPRREPSPPPQIPGLAFRSLIGMGGFADVFLYTESALGRDVAVKVLAQSPSPAELAGFRSEANVMAQLSSHPAIVPIYQVGTATDGRPYLIMEYCSGESISRRYRRQPLPVPEVLEIGIRVASAVETAHRAGILHRDVKPGNILTSAFGDPKLADFGIARVLSDDHAIVGYSVPWSPPEVVDERDVVDPRSDVWSIAATLHTLLAGHSPFEVAGAVNDSAHLMSRILSTSRPRLDRPDVTPGLDAVLARGMAPSVEDRHPSAMAFARSLQEMQVEMRLATTRIDVLDASARRGVPPEDADEPRTSVRPIAVIVPDEAGTVDRPIQVVGTGPRFAQPEHFTRTRVRPGEAPPPPPVGAPSTTTEPSEPTGERSRLLPTLLAAGAALVALVVVLFVFLGDDPEAPGPERLDSGGSQAPPQDPVAVPAPLPPTDVTGTQQGGTATFAWTQSDAEPGDTFRWTLAGSGQEPSWTLVDVPTAQVDVAQGETCIVVTTVRAGQQSDPSPLACAAQDR